MGDRVLTIISGGGLSINGKHVFCGDYIFSGHTMTLTLGYLAIKQYSPRRFILLHWASFLAALCGVIFLLLARGHYTIDVLLAYYVSSRLWWIYHTLAHNDTLKKAGPHNHLANLVGGGCSDSLKPKRPDLCPIGSVFPCREDSSGG